MRNTRDGRATRASRIRASGDSGYRNESCQVCGEPKKRILGQIVLQCNLATFFCDFEKHIQRELRLFVHVCHPCMKRLADVIDRALETA